MDQEYTQRLDKIEKELERWLPRELTESSLSVKWAEQVFTDTGKKTNRELIRFMLEPLRELLYRGGKRWRPLLMTIVCETLGGKDAAVPLAPIIEFTHNASLIHDDIEDESDERRGKPAVHKTYGVDTAINSGSFLYFLASCCIETYGHSIGALNNNGQIFKLWSESLRKLHLGQAIDINWHRNVSLIPETDDYFLMCKLKTGSLAHLAAELGAYAAGASPETVHLLGDAADMMGVGFQILDDVKNLTTGNPGKKRGDDIVEGKKSLPVLLYMQKYPEKRDRVFYCFHVAKREGGGAPEVEELIETLNNSGAIKEAQEKGQSLLKEAQAVFTSCKHDNIPINETLLDGFIKLIS
ncbi:MAG: polyprenyl synthetase family protein [Treponema sp.]|jgi:octaprenyl-diphosphate synthase|nr:polyprenyl synthetase family protein [Treponema sp.]